MVDLSRTPLSSILVLRDPRESWARCSLRPLRDREDVRFVSWREDLELVVGHRVLLDPEGPVLSEADADRGLFVIDSSWRRLPRIGSAVVDDPPRRSLPPLRTAYPRRSSTFQDPAAGLATVEALFAAAALLGRPDPTLLDGYRFAEAFLAANPGLAPGRR
jgi:pre-rRNA-processing protein TSR3